MDFKTRTLSELRARRAQLAAKNIVAGFDAFVDTIVLPVDQRQGSGSAFTPFRSMADFGQRITQAAGMSTNIELFPRMEKAGGNGPIMTGALATFGARTTYIGPVGKPAPHAVFGGLAEKAAVHSLGEPAKTTALEFGDGKLMLGQMRTLDEITYAAIEAAVGGHALARLVETADLVALVNWTMIPAMTEIFRDFTAKLLPKIAPNPARRFFFDLCDPEKRSVHDLNEALQAIAAFSAHGQVTLGLNLKEAQQVAAALRIQPAESDNESALVSMAAAIRDALRIATVVVHPRTCAACATAEGVAYVPGPYTTEPLITTGAGDHFNAGFSLGQLLGLSPEGCLGLGVTTSGHYVRTAQSPTVADLESFLANWK